MNHFISFNLGFLGLVQNRLYLFLDSFVWFYLKEANDCVSLVVQTKRQTKVEDNNLKKLHNEKSPKILPNGKLNIRIHGIFQLIAFIIQVKNKN